MSWIYRYAYTHNHARQEIYVPGVKFALLLYCVFYIRCFLLDLGLLYNFFSARFKIFSAWYGIFFSFISIYFVLCSVCLCKLLFVFNFYVLLVHLHDVHVCPELDPKSAIAQPRLMLKARRTRRAICELPL